MMKDLIKGIEEIINKHQQKFLDDVGETLVDEERLATEIAESLVVDEEKATKELLSHITEELFERSKGNPTGLYYIAIKIAKALSKGDVLKIKDRKVVEK